MLRRLNKRLSRYRIANEDLLCVLLPVADEEDGADDDYADEDESTEDRSYYSTC